jgi:hypothetical protein
MYTMKSAKVLLIIILFTGFLVINLVACDWQGSKAQNESTPQPAWEQAEDLRATFGAEMLHIQLTAIAENELAGQAHSNP